MPIMEFSSPFIIHVTLSYTLCFPRPPSMFNRNTSEEAALCSQAFLHPAEHCQQKPEELFPCCITADRTVTITIWILLMIFTFTLRFSLSRGETTCTLPDKSVLRGKEMDSMGLCLEYSLPPAVLWMGGRAWWVSPPSCPVVVENTDQSLWRMLKNEGWEPLGHKQLRL